MFDALRPRRNRPRQADPAWSVAEPAAAPVPPQLPPVLDTPVLPVPVLGSWPLHTLQRGLWMGLALAVLLAAGTAGWGWRLGQTGWKDGAAADLAPLAQSVAAQGQTLQQGQALVQRATASAQRLWDLTPTWAQQAQAWAAALPPKATLAEGVTAAQASAAVERIRWALQAVLHPQGVRPEAVQELVRALETLHAHTERALAAPGTATAQLNSPARKAVLALQVAVASAQAEAHTLAALAPQLQTLQVAHQALLHDGPRLGRTVQAALDSVGSRQLWWLATAVLALLGLGCGVALLALQRQQRRRQALAGRAQAPTAAQAPAPATAPSPAADCATPTTAPVRDAHVLHALQAATQRLSDTVTALQATSTQWEQAASGPWRDVRAAGQAVQDLAGRLTQVAEQAQGVVPVAQQALQASAHGARTLQDVAGAIDTLREQTHDSTRRLQRLGESSQELGVVAGLLSDITEQAHVLALNAAIQAAAAGDAGRGFSVVADAVQRLAERLADATHQLVAQVRTTQGDA
ncbi:MAG: methyl-accepting chemotaxis protein, partial [Macromonas bipunctata]|nr:methyl-accepting chemotaxis protein [Macromonas bipunctata]